MKKDPTVAVKSQTGLLSGARRDQAVGRVGFVQQWELMTGGGKCCWQQHVIGRWNPASSLRLNSKPLLRRSACLVKQYGPSRGNIGVDPEVDQVFYDRCVAHLASPLYLTLIQAAAAGRTVSLPRSDSNTGRCEASLLRSAS